MAPAGDEIKLVAEVAVRPAHPEMDPERDKSKRDGGMVENEAERFNHVRRFL